MDIIKKSNIAQDIALFDNNFNELYNNGLNISIKELKKIKKLKKKYSINGLTINNIKYVILNIQQINNNYFIHCKNNNDGLVIILNNNINIFTYYNEFIPYQYNKIIQKIINQLCK
jgi:hypothetical protein